jgi:hypothetical protein
VLTQIITIEREDYTLTTITVLSIQDIMKKTFLVLTLSLVIALAGCIQPVAGVETLELQNFPDVTDFTVGDDDIDISDVVVVVTFDDDTDQSLSISDVTLTGNGYRLVGGVEYLDLSTVGEKSITISYGGVSTTVTFVVRYTPWVENIDTAWYTADPDALTFTIDTSAELAGLASIVNAGTDTFEGHTVVLGASIDLLEARWTPIGTATGHLQAIENPNYAANYVAITDIKPFAGTFDGNGMTISNLYINRINNSYLGLFGVLGAGAVIQDLTVSDAFVSGFEATAIVAGLARGAVTVSNVTVTNSELVAGHWAAAILGYVASGGTVTGSTVSNTTVTGYLYDVDANGDKIGGLIGYVNDPYTITNNTIDGVEIYGYRDTGALVGFVNYNLENTITGNTVTDVVLRLDKDQLIEQSPVYYDGSKSGRIGIGIFVGRQDSAFAFDASNTHSGVATYIREEDEANYTRYISRPEGSMYLADYTPY